MIPDKPGWWWWSSGLNDEHLVPLEVDPCDREKRPDPLDWHVLFPYPLAEHELGMVLLGTGRTVRTMGGVWLGPCAPPERSEP